MPDTITSPAGVDDTHRLIFSANPGRSGSAYLARLLGASPAVDAGHERDPALTGPWLRRVAYRGESESYDDRRLKAWAIRSDLAQLPDTTVYADTSHLFLKTFADVVFDEFAHDLITVIALRRDPVLTARSYFQLGTLGANRLAWHGWVPFPTAPGMRFRLERQEITNQFDLIFGSLVDSVARMNHFRGRTPDVAWIDADLASISTTEGAAALFGELGIEPPEPIADAVAGPTNEKPTEKRLVDLDVSTEQVSDRLDDFVERFGDRPAVAAFVSHHRLERYRS